MSRGWRGHRREHALAARGIEVRPDYSRIEAIKRPRWSPSPLPFDTRPEEANLVRYLADTVPGVASVTYYTDGKNTNEYLFRMEDGTVHQIGFDQVYYDEKEGKGEIAFWSAHSWPERSGLGKKFLLAIQKYAREHNMEILALEAEMGAAFLHKMGFDFCDSGWCMLWSPE